MADQDPYAATAVKDPYAATVVGSTAPQSPAAPAAAPLPNAGLAPAAGAPNPASIQLPAGNNYVASSSPNTPPPAPVATLAREVGAAGSALNPLSVLKNIASGGYNDIATGHIPFIHSMVTEPVKTAYNAYAPGGLMHQGGGVYQNILENAPEGIGTGAGNVVGGRVIGEVAPKITEAAKTAAEGAGGIVKGAAKASGIGLSPIEKLVKAAGPSVRDANFPQRLETAAPEIARQNAVSPIKSVQDMSDAAHTAANNLWTQRIEPQITRNASQTIDGRQVANGIRNGIDPGSRDLFPEQAAKAEDLASKFDGPLTLTKSNDYLKTLNAQLKGFYKMSPEARAAAGVTDGRISSMEDAASGLRQQMYAKLDSLGETDPAGLRQQYGALKDVQSVFGKRAIVSGRQAPLNLAQMIAIAGGAGEGASQLLAGHPAAAAAGAVPIAATTLMKYLNSPDSLARRGVSGLDVPPPVPSEPVPAEVPQPSVPAPLAPAVAPQAHPAGPTQLPASPLERMKQLAAFPGEGRTTMSATEFNDALKNNRSMRTPFDYTEGARQTVNTPGSEEAQRGRAAEIAKKYPVQSINPVRDPFAAPARAAEAPGPEKTAGPQGGHAGNKAASDEELARPGTNYIVKSNGALTYHGKSFAPEETPAGGAHVTVLPDGKFRVNNGTLSPTMETALKNGLKK